MNVAAVQPVLQNVISRRTFLSSRNLTAVEAVVASQVIVIAILTLFWAVVQFLIWIRLGETISINAARLLWLALAVFIISGPVTQLWPRDNLFEVVIVATIVSGFLVLILETQSLSLHRFLLALSFVLLGVLGYSNTKDSNRGYLFDREAVNPQSTELPDVLWLIADELPAAVIYDEQNEVRDIFPNLRQFADTATSYVNAFTPFVHTNAAIPALLAGSTGNMMESREKNLRMSFEDSAAANLEKISEQYSLRIRSFLAPKESWYLRMLELSADLFAVFGKTALPDSLGALFPSIDNSWRNFWGLGLTDSLYNRFTEFGSEWKNTSSPRFGIVHTLFTHRPHNSDFDGGTLNEFSPIRAEADLNSTSEELMRTLALAQFIEFDRRVGSLLNTISSISDRKNLMVVITADHGSLYSNVADTRNGSTAEFLGEVARVPLFVMYPEKVKKIIDVPVSTAQIMKTIFDTIELSPPSVSTLVPSLESNIAFDFRPRRRSMDSSSVWSHVPVTKFEFDQFVSKGADVGVSSWSTLLNTYSIEELRQFRLIGDIADTRLLEEFVPAEGTISIHKPKILSWSNRSSRLTSRHRIVEFSVYRSEERCTSSEGKGVITQDNRIVASAYWLRGGIAYAVVPKSDLAKITFWCPFDESADLSGALGVFDWVVEEGLSGSVVSRESGEVVVRPGSEGEIGAVGQWFDVGGYRSVVGRMSMSPGRGRAAVRVAWLDGGGTFLGLSDVKWVDLDLKQPTTVVVSVNRPLSAAQARIQVYFDGSRTSRYAFDPNHQLFGILN